MAQARSNNLKAVSTPSFSASRRVDVATAAEYLGLSPRHLRQLVFQRQIEHFKIGARLVFDLADLDEFLQSHRRSAVG